MINTCLLILVQYKFSFYGESVFSGLNSNLGHVVGSNSKPNGPMVSKLLSSFSFALKTKMSDS